MSGRKQTPPGRKPGATGRRTQKTDHRRNVRSRDRQAGSWKPAVGGVVVVVAALIALAWWIIRPSIPDFDEERAFTYLEQVVSFGPRVPGTNAHALAADWMVDELERFADQVTRQEFAVPTSGDTLHGTNVIASFNLDPERNARVMLSAHWDTRPWADAELDSANHNRSFPGANDGGSGVAVLLEIARALSQHQPEVGVDILLFDLEDSGRDTTVAYALGSEFFASNNPQYRPTFGINIDMVCDANLRIPREANSVSGAGHVVRMIWEAAEKEDAGAFVNESGMSVMDDHIPFLQRGIPVVNLIHLPFPDYWHTGEDDLDKCSAESLGQVGRVLLRVVYQ